MNKFEISINSEVAKIEQVENFITHIFAVLKLSSELHGRIILSVVEAVNNAILHGNKRNSTKLVTITAEKLDNLLQITIADEGEGFDYTEIPDPTSPKAIYNPTGRGLYLMKTLSDHLVFERNGATAILSFTL